MQSLPSKKSNDVLSKAYPEMEKLYSAIFENGSNTEKNELLKFLAEEVKQAETHIHTLAKQTTLLENHIAEAESEQNTLDEAQGLIKNI